MAEEVPANEDFWVQPKPMSKIGNDAGLDGKPNALVTSRLRLSAD